MTAEARLGPQLSGERAEIRREWLVTGAVEGLGALPSRPGGGCGMHRVKSLQGSVPAGAAFSWFPNSNAPSPRHHTHSALTPTLPQPRLLMAPVCLLRTGLVRPATAAAQAA